MNNKKILVSAIISTYNSEKFIRGKIEDLLAQTIIDKLEIIIVNSGSQQNEDEIIREYLDKYHNIKYIKTKERETIYKAWNRGIKISNGTFITNANTDDRLKHDAYEILSNYLLEHTDVALVYADQYISSIPNQKFTEIENGKIIHLPEFDRLLQFGRCIVLSQPMWRSSLHFKDNIWFEENLEICGDHEFELHISEKNIMKHLDVVLGIFYKSKKNKNKSFINKNLVKTERDIISLNYLQKYVHSLDLNEISKLKNKFAFYLRIPILIYFLFYWVFRTLGFMKNKLSPEVIYILIILIYNKLEKNREAEKYCNKFRRVRKSIRIEKCYSIIHPIKNKQ